MSSTKKIALIVNGQTRKQDKRIDVVITAPSKRLLRALDKAVAETAFNVLAAEPECR
jgi:hypothetical protein